MLLEDPRTWFANRLNVERERGIVIIRFYLDVTE